ncbi:hypothetical protein HMPREF1551_00612 [Capnocytophaga sp. oral taxon 863 str. F0517]|uniref:hypothetical protein n=1 Tax=Capnocytophaga sp. oral taxon 863 TaxID=1227265 RepID=UPI0003962C07|nr:hypothetical protein [Capnocytophaga sp. oral taxon 863]ERI64167.1 hypothetical protein HMPREF1551_00612 [Capnocytophaga sp. oral taxon 863 str. F0517]
MNRPLLLLLLFACSWASRANMAEPTMRGTSHSCLILTDACSVTHEKIFAEIIKDNKDSFNDYIIRFRAKYHISSAKEQSIPLLFMASNYLNDQQVFVNGQAIPTSPIDQEQDYPFLRQKEITDTLQYTNVPTEYHTYTKYYVSYDGEEELEVIPSQLIYFTAPLKAGENVIEVSYSAFPTTFRYGFLPPYIFEYSLYPSKFWKTFPEIEVEIHFPKELEFKQSSMEEDEYTVNNQLFQGKIKDIRTSGDCYWRFTPKPSWIGRLLLTIDPFGIGVLFFLVAAGLHLYTIRRKSKWGLWLGAFLVPLLFYVGFLGAYPFIDWVLGKRSLHGYIFLIVFTYPIFLMFYGIFTFLYYKHEKNKI